jgi:DNA-binding transcriptional ArsR family regulator
MSSARPKHRTAVKDRASLFAALGHETRLSLVGKLSSGPPQSISRLAEGSALTRQAITKHLRVLEDAGVVRRERVGRESRFAFRPEPLKEVRSYIDYVSSQCTGETESFRRGLGQGFSNGRGPGTRHQNPAVDHSATSVRRSSLSKTA